MSFKELCAHGQQYCSFQSYCIEHGVEYDLMQPILKEEYCNLKTLPGYRLIKRESKNGIARLCSQLYEDFKSLCAQGRCPGSFTRYCEQFGITRKQMHGYLRRNKLRVAGLPGSGIPEWHEGSSKCKEIPFEEVIFEDAGFLPAGDANVITVSVDGNVTVRFPADTDISVIAKFVKKVGKEVGHVES